MTAPFQATNGHLIVPLTDKPMLMQEAFSLSHCVGTYGYACAFDGRHVLSVRTEGGIPIATLAVKQHLATRWNPTRHQRVRRQVQRNAAGGSASCRERMDGCYR